MGSSKDGDKGAKLDAVADFDDATVQNDEAELRWLAWWVIYQRQGFESVGILLKVGVKVLSNGNVTPVVNVNRGLNECSFADFAKCLQEHGFSVCS